MIALIKLFVIASVCSSTSGSYRHEKREEIDSRFEDALNSVMDRRELDQLEGFAVDDYDLVGVKFDDEHYAGVGPLKNQPHRVGVNPIGLVVRTVGKPYGGVWEFCTDGGPLVYAALNYIGLARYADRVGEELMYAVLESIFPVAA